MIVNVLSDLARLPLRDGGRKSRYIIIIIIFAENSAIILTSGTHGNSTVNAWECSAFQACCEEI